LPFDHFTFVVNNSPFLSVNALDCLLSSAAFVVDSEDALLWLLLHNLPIVRRVRLIF
jgi:hypothetical protein